MKILKVILVEIPEATLKNPERSLKPRRVEKVRKKLQEVKKNVLLIQGKLVEILRGTAKEFKGGIVVEIKEETSKGIQGRIMEFREQS